jgi:hypothetical protein
MAARCIGLTATTDRFVGGGSVRTSSDAPRKCVAFPCTIRRSSASQRSFVESLVNNGQQQNSPEKPERSRTNKQSPVEIMKT